VRRGVVLVIWSAPYTGVIIMAIDYWKSKDR